MSMEKRQAEIKDLKEGGFIIIDEAPCRVEDVQISKAGKHGAAKARLTAVGIFDNVKRIIVKPGGAKVDVPIIEKKSMQVVAIMGNNAQLMDLETYDMREVPIPEELRGKLREGEEILVWKFGPHILLKDMK